MSWEGILKEWEKPSNWKNEFNRIYKQGFDRFDGADYMKYMAGDRWAKKATTPVFARFAKHLMEIEEKLEKADSFQEWKKGCEELIFMIGDMLNNHYGNYKGARQHLEDIGWL
jgi:hypothetical protein